MQDKPVRNRPMPSLKELSGSNLPLPPGRPMRVQRLTDTEREQLEELGWRDGEPIPENLPQLLAEAMAEAQTSAYDIGQMPLPVSPDQPPLRQPPSVPLEQATPERMRRVRSLFAEAAQTSTVAEDPIRPAQGPIAPGVMAAIQASSQPNIEVDMDVEPNKLAAEIAEGTTEEKDQTGALDKVTKCRNCGFSDLAADPIKPSAEDLESFVESTLALTPWQKCYSCLGGKLQVTIRQVSPAELDLCFNQVHSEQRANKTMDPYEQLTRYKACMQLVDIRTTEWSADFPQSIEAWKQKIGDVESPLVAIQQYVYDRIFKSEGLHRIVGQLINDFELLAKRMEENVRNANFWKPGQG